ncbi:HAD-IIA family hydrolase [Paenibacillus nasutitermitis]|uniref:Acid sugar phosphatase n=1 Tax=Paenibacillus nasutitermitis TaxID=1652958 RepID=A0A916Z4K1_9BACL|nr:HAD-IIA family hydrolase [Paenibacillus nasutitermitis]GGD76485.1 acid sugar phosphatase [Paenibacillus nasutitermitis]
MAVWQEKSTYLFDLDGCIYFGRTLAPGAGALLETLRAAGKNVGFVSNNSRDTGWEVARRLEAMGLSVQPEHIVTATEYMGAFISRRFGPSRLKVAGSSALIHSLEEAGHEVIPFGSGSVPELVVISRDTEFSYEKLQIAAADGARGARVVATNPDLHHPGENAARVPETGALLAALQPLLDDEIQILGKPEPYLFQYGMDLFGVARTESVFTGDNLQTDIKGGLALGLTTVWINSNQEPPGTHSSPDITPDYHFVDMRAFLESIHDSDYFKMKGRRTQ